MGSPLKTFVALVMVLAMVAFVYADVAVADAFKKPSPPQPMHFAKATAEHPAPPPPRMDRPKAIMPEEPLELKQQDESEDDSKKQSGHKNPKNAPATAKREYHRKMMYR